MCDKCELEGGLTAEERGGWRRYINTPDLKPLFTKGTMSSNEGVVQFHVRPHAAACLSNPRADHSGAGCAVSPHTTPGREYTHIRQYFSSLVLSTYVGQDRVGGVEVEFQPLWMSLRDEIGAPPEVDEVGLEGGGGGGGSVI